MTDKIIDAARAFIVEEVGVDMGKGMTDQAIRLVQRLYPVIADDVLEKYTVKVTDD